MSDPMILLGAAVLGGIGTAIGQKLYGKFSSNEPSPAAVTKSPNCTFDEKVCDLKHKAIDQALAAHETRLKHGETVFTEVKKQMSDMAGDIKVLLDRTEKGAGP